MSRPEELSDTLDATNAIDSPDLGPPPVATFGDGEPSDYPSTMLGIGSRKETHTREELQIPSLTNLETRRKRRESSHRSEVSRDTSMNRLSFEPTEISAILTTTSQPLKAGAKRKLGFCDLDSTGMAKASEREDLNPDKHPTENPTLVEQTVKSATSTAIRLSGLDVPEGCSSNQPDAASRQEKSKGIMLSSTAKVRKALGPSEFSIAIHPIARLSDNDVQRVSTQTP